MSGASIVEDIFLAALEKGTPEERAAFLDAACKDDADLRRRVERLLEAHPRAGGFLDGPARPVGGETAAYGPAGEQVGTVIAGRYKLLEQIGEGGMGAVWVAEQTQPVRRKVALKLIKPGMDSKAVLSRFEAERQALAVMDHPNIAKVLDGGATENGRPYFVMEYVKGIPFTRYCDDARLSLAQRLALFVPVCQAVQHAHQKGIIHRDLKPSNILVCLYDGKPVPKVIDFGLAKAMHQPLTEHTLHTAHGVMMGTPLYMSPEQAEFNNLDVDTRTDVYALGVILYELLTGTTPLEKQRFKEAAWQEMLRLIKDEEPQRPSARLSGSVSLPALAAQRQLEPVKLTRLVRGELDWIVMKCLEKDRGRRYDSATGLARDVERYLADEVVEARPPSAGYRLRKFVRRNKGRVIGAGVFVAMLLLVVGLVLYGIWWAERQSAERRHEQALIAARNNDAFKATLDQAEAALKAGRLEEAGTLLGQAHKQSDEHTLANLGERYELLKRDESTLRELNAIFEERWMISRSDTHLDPTRAKRRYPPLFQSYGLAVGTEPAAATEAKVRQSLIAEALSSGMTEWFFADPRYPGLLAVLDLLDRNSVHATLRAAIVEDPVHHYINKPTEMIDGSRLSPAFAVELAYRLPDSEAWRILKAAWTAHPDSFPLALTIAAKTLESGELAGEPVGWSRTAVALRPNNPLARYRLAIALIATGTTAPTFFSGTADTTEAVEELRQTIRLAPSFADAHGQLAMLLFRKSNAEALAEARKAIDLDGENIFGHTVLLRILTVRSEYIDAARVWRRIKHLKIPWTTGTTETGTDKYLLDSIMEAWGPLLSGLLSSRRPFEAYRVWLDAGPGVPFDAITPESSPVGRMSITVDLHGSVINPGSKYYAVRAAALAGTGQGLDAPAAAEQPAIRKHALDWLRRDLETSRKKAWAFPALAASSAGLIGSPFGHAPLLAVSALFCGQPDVFAEQAKDREVIHKRMNQWLSDADLTGVRDDQWLAKLPADEREQWRKLWGEVQSLRDQTAPGKSSAKP